MSRGSKNYYCGTFCWGTLQLTSCAISWQTKWRNLLVTMWNMQKWTFRTAFFLNEVSICIMAKVGGTILSRTTIISQSVFRSPIDQILLMMIQCMVGQKKMYNLSSLLKIRLSLWLFLYVMNVLSLWLYLWKKVFILKLIGLPCHPAGSPPSIPFLILFFSHRISFSLYFGHLNQK